MKDPYLYGYIKMFRPRVIVNGVPKDNYGFVCENGNPTNYFFHIENCRREDGKEVHADDLKAWVKVKFIPHEGNPKQGSMEKRMKATEVLILSF